MNTRLNFFFLTLSALLLCSHASAAPVKSMSLEVFKDGAERFWEVSVNCEAVPQPRVMRRPVDNDQWCSIEAKNLCDKNKFSLSRALCSDNFSKQVVNFKNGNPLAQTKEEAVTAKTAEKPAVDVNDVTKTKAKQANAFKPSQLASRESLLKEQMQIEEQRILIQQKRIELRRRELTLQKRQLNAS